TFMLAFTGITALREKYRYPLRPGEWPQSHVAIIYPVAHKAHARVVASRKALLTLVALEGHGLGGGWDCRVKNTDSDRWFYLKSTVSTGEEADRVTVRFPQDFSGVRRIGDGIYHVVFFRRSFHQLSRKPSGYHTLAETYFSTPIDMSKGRGKRQVPG
ncbi:MAG: hypothetical protein M3198_15430, partial [Actinomycetota bacterium]|nr:hypothetical protein [Actinomycetota bacterium]